ncbi:MAG: hypothetical protein ACSI46_01105 [Gloeotrichia echinulata DVL01]|jgi:hypothetical protein|nr:hypothetical protein [Gloeotrichia echinulata DEX184]
MWFIYLKIAVRTIRDRLLKNERQAIRLLKLYQKIWHQKKVVAVDSSEEKELLLSGLVVKRQEHIKVHNRIYQLVFNDNWVDQLLRGYETKAS